MRARVYTIAMREPLHDGACLKAERDHRGERKALVETREARVAHKLVVLDGVAHPRHLFRVEELVVREEPAHGDESKRRQPALHDYYCRCQPPPLENLCTEGPDTPSVARKVHLGH